MTWPNHADYAEAVQNPEICFELPELHTGEVATTPLGLPRAFSGNFASVYEVNGGGESYAVRCFVRQVTNQQDRYAALERHLEDIDLPFMVPFEFVTHGIRVHERWFPIVKMHWVTGTQFHHYVGQQLHSPERLAWLAADWRSLITDLKRHRIAHGDLQHGNILVTTEGDLRLVDYDGMYVPLFARECSPELGHANYQHPRRTVEFYDERLDHFPAILIYLSLRAMAAEPSLWDEYFNGDNLIATAVDLRVPGSSNLWPRLLESPDHDVRRLTVLLVECLQMAPADVPCLETLLSERLSQVTVPAELDFGAGKDAAAKVELARQERASSFLVEEIVAGRPGPLAAMNIGRTPSGSRQVPQTPRLLDVFGWSALVTATLALMPPLRSVAGLAALALAVPAWLMPGRTWQPSRVAAGLSAVIGLVCLLVGNDFSVAARRQDLGEDLPLETHAINQPLNFADPEPIAARPETDRQIAALEPGQNGLPATLPPLAQPVSRRLTEPARQQVARVVERWRPHSETVSAVTLSADGRHLVSAATDRSLAVWNLISKSPAFVRTNLVEPAIALTALTNVGIVTTLDAMHQMQWWSLDGRVPLKSVALDPDSLVVPTISPDGQVIALGGRSRREIALFFNSTPATSLLVSGLSSWAKLVRFSGDSRLMAIVCHDDTISLRRVETSTPLQTLEFPDTGISDVLFTPDGDRLVAVGEAGAIRIWKVADGSIAGDRRFPPQQLLVTPLTGERKNQLLAASGTKLLLLSAANDLAEEGELQTDSPVTVVTSLPGGKGFVTGHRDGGIAVWHIPSAADGDVMTLARP